MAKQKPNKSSNNPISQTPKKQVVSKPQAQQSSIFEGWLPIIGVLAVTFFAFLPTFQSDFVNWDDDVNILQNRNLNVFTFQNIINIFTTNIMGGYNPLPIVTFAIEKAIVGGTEGLSKFIHTDNLILHLLNVFLVYRLVGLMGFSRWSALVVALLFGIHPMRVESVAWATERKDVLFGAFYFASLIQYAKYLKSEHYGFSNRHFLLAFVLFVFALFSKVQAVSLPLSMLAMDYYFKRPLNFKLIFEKAHFFLGSLAMGLGTVILLKTEKTIDDTVLNYSIFEKIAVGFYTYLIYLGKCVYPWAMSPIYPFPKEISVGFYASSLFFIASLVGIWYAFRKGWTTLVFGWIFFFVNYIFVSQIVQAGQGYLADRFTYIPYFGFFVIMAVLTEGGLFKTKEENESEKMDKNVDWKVKVALAGYALLLFFTTYNQVKVWENGETLWTHAINFDDKIPTAWQNRALIYRDRKNYDKAIADLNMSLAVKPSAASYNSRGKTYFDMNKPVEGLADYNSALRLDSTLVEAWANRGAAYGQLGKLDSAMMDLSKALSLDSMHINALVNRGAALGVIGKKEEAIRDLTRVIELDSKHVNALVNRSLTYREIGQFDLALADCDRYLAIKKDNPNVWIDRALLKRQMNRCAEAIADFDEAIKLNSFNGAYYIERAQCYRILGNRAQMQADVQTARARGVQNIDPLLLQ
ncbi:MAG: tetratricopeptide repeat protein [Saprospiraceae bacterium]|nr:tetratricopeptide repeat protein [Saprospiraceae bacterium]